MQKRRTFAVHTLEFGVSNAQWTDEPEDTLTEEDIAAYLDGFEYATAKTERHMRHCSYCREFIRILETTPRPEQMERLKTWHCVNSEKNK